MAETIIQREAPDIEAMKLALMQAGIDLTKEGMTLPQQQVADMSGLQKLALDYAGQGIGSYIISECPCPKMDSLRVLGRVVRLHTSKHCVGLVATSCGLLYALGQQ